VGFICGSAGKTGSPIAMTFCAPAALEAAKAHGKLKHRAVREVSPREASASLCKRASLDAERHNRTLRHS